MQSTLGSASFMRLCTSKRTSRVTAVAAPSGTRGAGQDGCDPRPRGSGNPLRRWEGQVASENGLKILVLLAEQPQDKHKPLNSSPCSHRPPTQQPQQPQAQHSDSQAGSLRIARRLNSGASIGSVSSHHCMRKVYPTTKAAPLLLRVAFTSPHVNHALCCNY